jgi:hypothetical protein
MVGECKSYRLFTDTVSTLSSLYLYCAFKRTGKETLFLSLKISWSSPGEAMEKDENLGIVGVPVEFRPGMTKIQVRSAPA